MQILSIHLKNIKSHRATELTFSPGINVLSGPNGVGKSTIFEAIGYALFGVDAQSFVGKVEKFVSFGAKKGEIAVVFQLADGERFRASRTAGTPSKWLLAREVGGAFEVEEHKDARETEARLKELLGLDNGRSLAEQFELVIGPFQNEFLGPFVETRPATRRNKFDEILGIDSWRKTFSATNALQKAIKTRVEVLDAAIGPLKERVAALPELREELKASRQNQEASGKELVQKQQALKALEARLQEVDQREKVVKDLTHTIETLKERITNGQEKIGRQMVLVDEAKRSQQIVAENISGKQAYEQTEQRLRELREQQKQQRRMEQEEAQLKNQLTALVARQETEKKAIEQARQELLAEEKSLAEQRKAQAIDEGLQQQAARLPELGEKAKALRAQLGQLDGRRAGLKEGSEKLAEGVCPFFQEQCLNIAEKQPGDVFSAKFAELAAKGEHLQQELGALEREEGEARQASEELKAFAVQVKGLDEQAAKLAVRGKELDRRTAALESAYKQQVALQQQLGDKQAALAAFKTLAVDIERADSELKQNQPARDLYMAHQEQAAKLDGLQAELIKFETLLQQLQGEMASREADLKAASREYDAKQHQQLRDEKETLGREVAALMVTVKGFADAVARLAGEIDKLKVVEQEIVAKKKQIEAYGEKETLVKFLRNRVFNKVSAYLSERFREEISQRANRIYRIIAEVDEELAWGEDYSIILRDMEGGSLRERANNQLSGGQMMSAVVALRLALLQTIGARIAFFDEPTSNLDATRRENLAHAFRAIDVGREEVTEHWYDQLFLISHDVAFTEVTDQVVPIEPPS